MSLRHLWQLGAIPTLLVACCLTTVSSTRADSLSGNRLSIDSGGRAVGRFQPDAYYGSQECCGATGQTASTTTSIDTSGVRYPAPQAVYQTLRYAVAPGYFVYFFSNLTPSTTYRVRLHFAEFILDGANQRQFNVTAQGQTVLTNFDIYAAAGGKNRAVVRSFTAQTNNIGQLTLAFRPGQVGNPQVNGIELVSINQNDRASLNSIQLRIKDR
jgi:hypothetical protein